METESTTSKFGTGRSIAAIQQRPKQKASIIRHPWVVFALFAINGPAISIGGQFRIAEIAIILTALLNFSFVARSLRQQEQMLAGLFLLTAFSYLTFDYINQGIEGSTIARAGSYITLAVLFPAISWLIGKREDRLIAALLGFSFSFVIVLIFGISVPSAGYHNVPWRLGLGESATMALLILPLIFPSFRKIWISCLAILIVIHIGLGSRNLAILSIIAFVISIKSYMLGSVAPKPLKIKAFSRKIFLGVLVLICLWALTLQAVSLKLLPTEMQDRMEQQLSNNYGLLFAARPDTAAAIYGISRQPLTGYGSNTVSLEVYRFYASVASSSYQDIADELYESILLRETEKGTPSHSHLFGAWVDAGILAAISWIVVSILCLKTIVRASSYRSDWTPLTTFIGLTTLWDVFFSPGPVRLDIALMLVFLIFVNRKMNAEQEN